jgi:hypothetical protein
MTSYYIRDIPDDLWIKAKTRAAKEGVPLRIVILALLTAYVHHGIPEPEGKAK